MSIFDAAMRYAEERVPLVVIAGREYGTGSSRDWAAKGSSLLGVRAVIAESFERIHRANLAAMGVLPLQLAAGTTRASLRLDGSERIDLLDLDKTVAPRAIIRARIRRADGTIGEIGLRCRIDTASEARVWRAGGMMPFVLRRLARPELETA
jgi:aconitate hydratase